MFFVFFCAFNHVQNWTKLYKSYKMTNQTPFTIQSPWITKFLTKFLIYNRLTVLDMIKINIFSSRNTYFFYCNVFYHLTCDRQFFNKNEEILTIYLTSMKQQTRPYVNKQMEGVSLSLWPDPSINVLQDASKTSKLVNKVNFRQPVKPGSSDE